MDSTRLAEIREYSFDPARNLNWADFAIDDLIAAIDRRDAALRIAIDALRSHAAPHVLDDIADMLAARLDDAA